MKRTVRLVNVQGDQEEFADLIGTEGELKPTAEGLTYFPNDRTDWLTLAKKRETSKNGTVKVSTKLGNTFTFRELPCT